MNIYVSNLGYGIQDQDLSDLFTPFGEVTSAKVITDKFTSRSKGFGFVEMSDDTAGELAIKELNGSVVEGRPLNVTVAKPREERSNNNRGGGFNKRW